MKKIRKRISIIAIMFIFVGILLFSWINKLEIKKEIINTLSEAKEENKEDTNKKDDEKTKRPTKDNKHNSEEVNTKEDSSNKDNTNLGDNKKQEEKSVPDKNLNKEGEKEAIPAKDVEEYLNGSKSDNNKYVFLTFDDGPSEDSTASILKILKDKDVKATFFMVGNNIERSPKNKELVNRVYNEGHAIGNHTYYHDYKKIYPGNSIDVKTFINEVDMTNNSLKKILGNDFYTDIVRMPGGEMSRRYYNDPNLSNLKNEFKKRNIYSIDWNSLNGDAEGKPYTVEEMINYVKQTSHGKNKVVILMHDANGKHKTIEALPAIIEYFKSQGYEFKAIKS